MLGEGCEPRVRACESEELEVGNTMINVSIVWVTF